MYHPAIFKTRYITAYFRWDVLNNSDRKQYSESNNTAEKNEIEHNKTADNTTPPLPSPSVLSVQPREEQQTVEEDQQQIRQHRQTVKAERVKSEEMNNHSVPDDVIIKSNTEPIQTTKTVSTYSQYSSTRSSSEDFYDESVIYKAQQQLKDIGYSPGKVDGKIGRQTTKALMEFQKYNNLSISGKLDSNTLAALSDISSQVNSALQKNNNVNIVAYFKSPKIDRTPSAVNPHMHKPVNNQIAQTNNSTNFGSTNFGEVQLQVQTEVQTNLFGFTRDTFGGNSFSNSNFVSQDGIFMPWGGFQGDSFGNYTAKRTPLSNFVTATGILSSMPSTSHMLHTIHHHR